MSWRWLPFKIISFLVKAIGNKDGTFRSPGCQRTVLELGTAKLPAKLGTAS